MGARAERVSVVITTYNRPDALVLTLLGLLHQTVAPHEVLVADDGSRPDTLAALQALPQAGIRWPWPLAHVWIPDQGFRAGTARNRGVQQATGDRVLFLDGDCIARRRCIEGHLALAGRAAAPVLVTGSRVLMSEGLTAHWLSTLAEGGAGVAATAITQLEQAWPSLRWRLGGQVNKLSHLAYVPGVAHPVAERFAWRRIKSANLSMPMHVLQQINGFDETFVGWGHEDADVVLRAMQAGCRRVDGHWATEVLHLWHAERKAGEESANRQRVQARLDAAPGSLPPRAPLGLAEAVGDPSVVVTRLN
jgi:GT2 family glycosyltransferase